MRLLLLCWRSAMSRCTPLMIVQVVMTVWQDDFSWTGVLEKILAAAVAWGTVGLAVAMVAWLLLYRRARAAGIELSAQALDERQAHLLWETRPDEGGLDRVRERLTSSERAYLLLEPARDELTFRWRPGRRADIAALMLDGNTEMMEVVFQPADDRIGPAPTQPQRAPEAPLQVGIVELQARKAALELQRVSRLGRRVCTACVTGSCRGFRD